MYAVGQKVETPDRAPSAGGTVLEVYDEGRFYKVERVYGRKRWIRKYTLKELDEAAAAVKKRAVDKLQRRKEHPSPSARRRKAS